MRNLLKIALFGFVFIPLFINPALIKAQSCGCEQRNTAGSEPRCVVSENLCSSSAQWAYCVPFSSTGNCDTCRCIMNGVTPTLPPVTGSCGCSYNTTGGTCYLASTGSTCNEGYTPSCVSGPAMGQCSCRCTTASTDCGNENEVCCFTEPKCISGLTCDPRGGVCYKSSTSPGLQSEELCADRTSINTAIGCVPILNEDINPFMAFILRWSLGIGGGITFLLIILASFQIITAAADPKKVQAGKELLTAAITGLLVIIFAAFALRVIGLDILKIPGL